METCVNGNFQLLTVVAIVEALMVCCAPTGNRDGFISDRPLSDYITQFEPLYYDRQLLQSDHHRVKRSADRQLTLQIHAYGRTLKIRLKRDTGIYSPDLVVENGTNTVQYDASRAYVGYVEGEDSSVHGMVTSDGLFEGQIHTVDEQYIVERASRYFKETTTVSGPSFVQPSFHSVIYKHSAVDTGNINSSLCLSDLLHRKLMDEQRQMGSAWYRQRRSREGYRYADTVLNRFDKDPFRERASAYHQYHRDVDPSKTTCTMYIQADHLFYEKFDRNEDTVIEQLTQHVQGVNEIYRTIDFDGDGYPDNINFIIKRIKIWTSAKAPGYKFAGNYGVETFLELLSEDNFDAFCLAYMFTYRDFDGGTLGLAWTGDLQNAGGVCEKNGQYRGSLKSLNSGIVTILNYGKDVPPSVSHVTMAHEVGHNIGSQHDPETLECSPGGNIGNYIMYARATSGDRPNNNKFSTCSKQSMAQVMSVKARGHDGCFIPATSAICGNAVVEGDEECDCGWEDECQEQCCHPQVSSGGSGIPCTRKRGAECSPSEGPCCSSNCKLIGGSHSDRRYLCREPTSCKSASFCNGSSAACPPSSNVPDKTKCDEDSVCFRGECSGSICLAYDLESCQCPPSQLGDFRDSNLCRLCCKLPGDGRPCKSSFQWNSDPFNVPDLNVKPGAPCYSDKGYCDVFLKCREVDPTGPLANLKHLLFTARGMKSMKHWLSVYWYIPSIVGAVLFLFLAVLIKLCSHSGFVTKSVSQEKPSSPETRPALPGMVLQQVTEYTGSPQQWIKRQAKWIGSVRCPPSTKIASVRSPPEYRPACTSSGALPNGQKDNSRRQIASWV